MIQKRLRVVIAEAAQPIKAGADHSRRERRNDLQLMPYSIGNDSQAEVTQRPPHQTGWLAKAMGCWCERDETKPLSHPSVAPSQTMETNGNFFEMEGWQGLERRPPVGETGVLNN